MKIAAPKLSIRQDLNRALMTYFEGDVLLRSQVSLILKNFPPTQASSPLYRTLRLPDPEVRATRQVEFKVPFVSVALTVEASLYAAISYAHDNVDDLTGYFVVWKFTDLKVMIPHEKIVELVNTFGKPYRIARTKNEKVLVAGNDFVGRSVANFSARFAEHKHWPKVDSPAKVRAMLRKKP